VLHPRKDHRATVFVFHCLTGKASWMDEMARKSWVPTSLGDHVKYVFVDAGDSHSWFNLDANALSVATKLVAGSGEFVDRSSLDASMARVVQMIDAEAALVAGAHASIYLVGLSQGGMLALWTGLMGGIRQLGGVAVMNTIFPVHNVGSSVLHPDLPVAHFHGALDTTLPRPLAGYRKRRAELAGARNYRIATVWGGHWPSTQCKDAIGGWLQSRIL
jgi:predicted esterase